MRTFKNGSRRLFQSDPETAKIVSEMLLEHEKNGMNAVRKYSKKFDGWDPDDFELDEKQINQSISKLDPKIMEDTEFCQANLIIMHYFWRIRNCLKNKNWLFILSTFLNFRKRLLRVN